MTSPVLETRNLTRSYGKGVNRFDALKGISLSIEKGESLAIVGRSGSGTSTLMHLLALLDTPTSGDILLDGSDASRLKGAALNRTRNETFGFVPPAVLPHPEHLRDRQRDLATRDRGSWSARAEAASARGPGDPRHHR